MTHTLVVGGAPVPGAEAFYRDLLASAPRVIAADSAAEWCVSLGRVPDIAVGDFDSAAPGAVERLLALDVDVVTAPCDKDETDLEIAVAIAAGSNVPVVITACFTRRLDHTLAAVGALTRAGRGAGIHEPSWRAWLVASDSPLDVDLRGGSTVSVLAVDAAAGVDVEGVVWPLSGAALRPLSGHGVSNLVTVGPVHVAVADGTLVVIALDNPTDGLY